MLVSNYISAASLAMSSITATCAIYLSFVALRHTAKPNVGVKLGSDSVIRREQRTILIFELFNAGYWYAHPVVINLTLFFNFDPEFELLESRYGSAQTYVRSDPKCGVGGSVYLKATGLKLAYGEEAEAVHIVLNSPKKTGIYHVRVVGFSENGANLTKVFELECQ